MEIFKQLKKLGYNHYVDLTIEELDTLSSNSIKKRIEYCLVTDWFREKYGIHIDMDFGYKGWGYGFILVGTSLEYDWDHFEDGHNWDYYQALESAILKAIELIKTK